MVRKIGVEGDVDTRVGGHELSRGEVDHVGAARGQEEGAGDDGGDDGEAHGNERAVLAPRHDRHQHLKAGALTLPLHYRKGLSWGEAGLPRTRWTSRCSSAAA